MTSLDKWLNGIHPITRDRVSTLVDIIRVQAEALEKIRSKPMGVVKVVSEAQAEVEKIIGGGDGE